MFGHTERGKPQFFGLPSHRGRIGRGVGGEEKYSYLHCFFLLWRFLPAVIPTPCGSAARPATTRRKCGPAPFLLKQQLPGPGGTTAGPPGKALNARRLCDAVLRPDHGCDHLCSGQGARRRTPVLPVYATRRAAGVRPSPRRSRAAPHSSPDRTAAPAHPSVLTPKFPGPRPCLSPPT